MQEEANLIQSVKIPLTIEGQLERYVASSSNIHHERYEVLWHAWKQNKIWIAQLLQGTFISFPTYSRHDESHAQTVLHNIELILGEKRIATLSASECFVLLHTVYIHDIGMLITAADQNTIVSNEKFIEMVDYLEQEGDGSLRNAVTALKKTDYTYTSENKSQVKEKLYRDKLQVYYAFIKLFANYRRSEHGEQSKNRLYEWTKESNKLGAGFSLAGIPQRIFLTIAECAQMHTEPEFDSIMRLPHEDDGYVFDYIHPRFVSVLLMLGDILDMDNDRFHPLALLSVDDIPELSMAHYRKHLSIRKLHISPQIIEIAADCENQNALRLVRKECDMLTGILQQAGYAWSSICPSGFSGALPTLGSVELYLSGKGIPRELVSAKFEIPQKRAFEILEGANLYANKYAFLREFLQNAIDATKIQYWKECMSAIAFEKKDSKTIKIQSPYDLETYVSTAKYPIEIEMEICKQNVNNDILPITSEDIKNIDKNCTYGVNVSIRDMGIGIDHDSILRISSVGKSTSKDNKILKEMPTWLKPTAEFGVGLQSAFLVTPLFKCITHTRSEEKYEITFGSGALAQYDGYINVKPSEKSTGKDEDAYGTKFDVFVENGKKMKHEDYPDSWGGEDFFDVDYDRLRPIRHSAELMSQMILYLDSLVGESLFPIKLSVRKLDEIKIPINVTEKNTVRTIKICGI